MKVKIKDKGKGKTNIRLGPAYIRIVDENGDWVFLSRGEEKEVSDYVAGILKKQYGGVVEFIKEKTTKGGNDGSRED